jgi:hypothetical protein
MYIANKRDISKFNSFSPLQLTNGLIDVSPAIAHICIYLSDGSNSTKAENSISI